MIITTYAAAAANVDKCNYICISFARNVHTHVGVQYKSAKKQY